MQLFNLVLLDLTWREVVADIPVDATALVLYAVCLLLALLVWQGSRPKAGRTSSPDAPETGTATPAVAAVDPGGSVRARSSRKRRRRDPNEITWIIG